MNIRSKHEPQVDQDQKDLYVLVNMNEDMRKYEKYKPLVHRGLTPIEMKVSEARKLNMRYYQRHAALRKNATGKSSGVSAGKQTRKYAPYNTNADKMLFGTTCDKPEKLSLLQTIRENKELALQFQNQMTTTLFRTSQVTPSMNPGIPQEENIELVNHSQAVIVNKDDLNTFISDFDAAPSDLTQEEKNLLDNMYETSAEEESEGLRF